MKTKLSTWLGREFVDLIGEGKAGAAPDRAANELFEQVEAELQFHALSLDDAVRVRVWGRDADARTLATAARSKILTGKRKGASSSFISADWFDSNASAGLELLAMRPLAGAAQRNPVDFEPARNYLRYLDYDGMLFFSGFTSEATTLEQQATEILGSIDAALRSARVDWRSVVKLSALLQRSQDIATVRTAVAKIMGQQTFEFEVAFVDGFAGEKYLLEIEATAARR